MVLDGWTLDVSAHGARLLLFSERAGELESMGPALVPDEIVELAINGGESRFARVVWVQYEKDGVVAGFEILQRNSFRARTAEAKRL
jgi:hypothetical protein